MVGGKGGGRSFIFQRGPFTCLQVRVEVTFAFRGIAFQNAEIGIEVPFTVLSGAGGPFTYLQVRIEVPFHIQCVH
jgi:hypothetical protein